MFGFGKSKQSTTVVVEPEPDEVVVEPVFPSVRTPESELSELECEEYRRLAKQVGFRPANLIREEIVDILRRLERPVFDRQEVEAYLDAKFLSGKSSPRWAWIPLRDADDSKLTNNRKDNQNGVIVKGSYQRGVPLFVLRLVQQVSEEVPEAVFYVSDDPRYSSAEDPFLGVTAAGMSMLIIAQWDEPGFRGTAKPIE